jgi:murein DD-endopeptidase MepM/ murein hydrolase activator NlpD
MVNRLRPSRAYPAQTSFNADLRFSRGLFIFLHLLVGFSFLVTSCAGESAYWIPPSAPLRAAAQPEQPLPPASSTTSAPPAPQTDPALPAIETSASLTPLPAQGASAVYSPSLVIVMPGSGGGSDPAVLPLEATPTSEILINPLAVTPAVLALDPPAGENPLTNAPILYYAQAADTLPAVAVRFNVQPGEITSADPIPESAFLSPGQLLVIPRRLANTTSPEHLIPDSEVVYSPSAIDFDITSYVQQAGGKLATHDEFLKSTGMLSGADLIQRVADDNSINPRLLLALLEYHGHWVLGRPANQTEETYPLGKKDLSQKGLYRQMIWAVNQLSIGYYAYREGRLTEIEFRDGVKARLAPDLNAGTAALQYFFAQIYDSQRWLEAMDSEKGFPALYDRMFGSTWERAQRVEPLFPAGIQQPPLSLPFVRGWTWAYTGGPHGAYEHDGAFAALDFAPGTKLTGCDTSGTWILSPASGLVTRSENGMVVIDLDGDGHEQTGWVLTFLHVAEQDRIPPGSWVDLDDQIGHASCEGGFSTGTHVHIARKYNGEWVPAAGPLPFNLGGWIAHAGAAAYKGTMTRGDVTLTACTCSSANTFITRGPDDP